MITEEQMESTEIVEEQESNGFNGFTDNDEEALEALLTNRTGESTEEHGEEQDTSQETDEVPTDESGDDKETTEESEESEKGGEEQQEPQKSEEQQKAEDDFLASIPEEHREGVVQRLRALEEHAKKQEMAAKSAVGRAAFLQSQYNKYQNQIKQGGDNPKRFRLKPLSETPEWAAFKESDPVAAQAYEAQMKSYLSSLEEQLEEYTAPIAEMTASQERLRREQEEQHVSALYEADPDWQAKISQRSNTDLSYANWLDYMDQQIPGFKQHANSVMFAYGDEHSGPGMVDIWLEYDKSYNAKMQERMAFQYQQTTQMQEGTRLAQQRSNKQETAPPAKPKSPPVQPLKGKKEEDPNDALERIVQEDIKRRNAGGLNRF